MIRASRAFRSPCLFGLLALLGLTVVLPAAARAADPASIVLVSIDTLRSDRLPAYGYARGATPAIDALARDGILFEHAYAHTPLTLPSHLTILSGLLPGDHGVRDNLGYGFDAARHPHLPALLRAAGYSTGAAVSSFVLRPETGMAAGFDLYEASLDPGASSDLGAADRPGAETLRHARGFLEANAAGGKPFFLFVHFYEPHSPYAPPAPFAGRFADPYDGEVAAADALVGELVADLQRLGVYERAAIVLLSDHGEGLGDHGEAEHGVLLYREALQVPLIVKLPKERRKGSRVAVPAQLVDVAPTLLELAGLAAHPAMKGRALTDLDGGETRTIFAETFYPRLHMGWSELASVIRFPDHLIEGPDPELYDLAADPAETKNRRDLERRTLHALRGALAPFRVGLAAPGGEDPETAAKLAALGYLGGPAAAPTGALPDPKSRIATLETFGRASTLFAAKKSAEAAALLEELTRQNPAMVDAWSMLARAYGRMQEHDKALAAHRKTMELSGGAPAAALGMAEALRQAKRFDEARAHARLALDSSPVHAHLALASIAIAAKDPAVAEAETRSALAAGGPRVGSLLLLARALHDQKRFDEALATLAAAEQELAQLTTPEKTFPGLYQLRGDVLAASDRRGEAREAYKKEIAAFPESPGAYARLARVYAAVGRRTEGLRVVRDMIATSPADPAIHRAAVQVLRAMRAFPEAEEVAREAARKFPDDPSIRKLADRETVIEEEDLVP